MAEAYATGINQKTGKRETYQRKADYLAGRARKSNSAGRQRRRVLGSGR